MPHIMIAIAPYYEEIAGHLLDGAKAALDEKRATYEIYDVSGALEIPMAIKYGIMREESRSTKHWKFDGFVALGCVLRGETSHYDIVCETSAQALSQLSLEYNVPIGNGILTCDTRAQATERADPAQKNRGADAVHAVFSLLDVQRALRA